MRGVTWLVVVAGCGFGGASSDGPSDDSSTDSADESSTDTTDNPGDDAPTDNSDDMSTDAPDPDAPTAFDLSTCPASYISIAGAPSRYRFGASNSNAFDAFRVCANDLPLATHPVVFETQGELDALQAEVVTNRNGKYWTGAIQPLGADDPGSGWIWITGGTVPPAFWRSPIEPTDYNVDEQEPDGDEHDSEQFVRLDHFAASGLVDVPGSIDAFLLCECDGTPVDPGAKSVFDTLTP